MFTFFLAFFSANLLVGCSSDSENSMLVVSDKANTNEIVDSEQAYMLLTTDYLDYLNIVDKELLNEMSIKEQIKTVMAYKLAEHITLADSLYTIDITKEEAEKMGISKEVYAQCYHDILVINEEVSKIKGCKNHDIHLLDYKKFVKENKGVENAFFYSLKAKKKEPQRGLITTTSGDWGYTTFFPNIFHSKVEFLGYSNAAILSVVTCSVEQWNNVHSGTASGIMGQPLQIVLNLFVSGSGVSAKLGFKTADSNGGSTTWRAMDDKGTTHESK